MNGLRLVNLSVQTTGGKIILNNVNLDFLDDQIYVIRGRNGCGKSTLANTIMGHPNYVVKNGQIILDDKDLTAMPTSARAKLGLFLATQYPIEVSGISYGSFLKTVLTELNPGGFTFSDTITELERNAVSLGFNNFDYHRDLNVGFSGGEKKKSEILQMLAIKPRFAILDEPDSGLDKSSIKKLGSILNNLDYPTTLIIISHHQELINNLNVTKVYNIEELNAG